MSTSLWADLHVQDADWQHVRPKHIMTGLEQAGFWVRATRHGYDLVAPPLTLAVAAWMQVPQPTDATARSVRFSLWLALQHTVPGYATLRLSLGVSPPPDPHFPQAWLAWSTLLAQMLPVTCGWASWYERHHLAPAELGARLEALAPPPVLWTTIVGPRYVERLGFDRLLNAPAWRSQLLANGAVAITLNPHAGADAAARERVSTYLWPA